MNHGDVFPSAGGGVLAPSEADVLVAFTTAGVGTLSTTQLGTVATLQTAALPYPRLQLPDFTGKSGKQLQQTVCVPNASGFVGVFNAGVEGTDATLAAVLRPGSVNKIVAPTASATGGATVVLGGGTIRVPFPLGKNVTATTKLLPGTFASPRVAMLTSVLGVVVYVGSSNTIVGIPFSLNNDGTFRAWASSFTTLKGSGTNYGARIIRYTDTTAVVTWQDSTNTRNEYVGLSVTGGAAPSMTTGSVVNDATLVATAVDRINYNNVASSHLTLDASGSAFWHYGSKETRTNGSTIYRCSMNTGTLAITLHAVLTTVGSGNHGNFMEGVSVENDKILVPYYNSETDAGYKYLTYSGSISTTWTLASANGSFAALNNAPMHTRIMRAGDALNEFVVLGHQGSTNGWAMRLSIDLSNGTPSNIQRHGWTANDVIPLDGTNFFATFCFDSEVINMFTPTSLDLLGGPNMGVASAADPAYMNGRPFNRDLMQWPFTVVGGPGVHQTTRRLVTVGMLQVDASNTHIMAAVYAWPKR